MCEPTTLLAIGTAVSAAGTLYGAVSGAAAQRDLARQQEEQARVERMLAAQEDERVRARMRAEIGRQRAQLAGRGVSLDSPSAILLGEQAAREMSFESQAVRSRGAARSAELTAAARQSRALGTRTLISGGLGAAGSVLNRAPDLWPSLRSSAPSSRPLG